METSPPTVTWMRVTNRTERRLSLHWIDDAGVRRFHAEVLPSTTHTQAATPGRPWAIVEPDGRERGVYYPDTVGRLIVVDDAGGELLDRVVATPPGMSRTDSSSGTISVERFLPDGRPVWAPDVDFLDEFGAGTGAVAVFTSDTQRVRIMMWTFPDETAAAGFASKLVSHYARYIERVPAAGSFDVPDGGGISGVFGGAGGGALAVCAHGSIGLVVLAVGTDGDVDVVRSLVADQRERLP